MIGLMRSIKRTRRAKPPFGERLAAARIRVGLTQTEVGNRFGLTQRAIAAWEGHQNSSPNPEQVVQLADLYEVTVQELLCGDPEQIRKKPGPKGKLHRLFNEIAELPRRQQKDLIEVLEIMVRSKRKRAAEAEA